MYPSFNFSLPSYSVMAFFGGMSAFTYIYYQMRGFGLRLKDLLKIIIVCAIGGCIGGRALFFITTIPSLVTDFSVGRLLHAILFGGIVFYGGLFGVLLALKLYAKRSVCTAGEIFTLFAPAIPLFHGFGRIGCFLAGCCYGKPLSAPITITDGIVLDRIPVQLIEAAFEFIIFGILVFLDRKEKYNLLGIYLVVYALFRFIIEFFRGDDIRGIFLFFSTAQWISLVILTVYLVIIIRFKWKKGRECTTTMNT